MGFRIDDIKELVEHTSREVQGRCVQRYGQPNPNTQHASFNSIIMESLSNIIRKAEEWELNINSSQIREECLKARRADEREQLGLHVQQSPTNEPKPLRVAKMLSEKTPVSCM
jgi:hypothetical protein